MMVHVCFQATKLTCSHFSEAVSSFTFTADKTFKKLHDKPAVGRSFILDPNRISFTWCTSTVTEVLEEQENYCKFKTQNSVYQLWKLNAND